MKITFILSDTWGAWNHMEYNNTRISPAKRTVSIELTPEQIDQIGIRVVGNNCGRAMMETIQECFVEVP